MTKRRPAISQRARQDGGPDERVILPLVEGVTQDRHRVTPRTPARFRSPRRRRSRSPREPVVHPGRGSEATTKRHASTTIDRAKTARHARKVRVRWVRRRPPHCACACACGSFLPPFPSPCGARTARPRIEDSVEGDRRDDPWYTACVRCSDSAAPDSVAKVRQAEFIERDPGDGQVEDLGPSPSVSPYTFGKYFFRLPGESALRVGPERLKPPEDHRFAWTRARRRDPPFSTRWRHSSHFTILGRRCSTRTSAR